MAELGGQSFAQETLRSFAPILASSLVRRGSPSAAAGRRARLVAAATEGALSFAMFERPE
jgi:hypothetical protein